MIMSAHQINTLSKQGTDAIFNVASILDSSRAVSRSLARTERFASQYIVLQSPDVYQQFQSQYLLLNNHLTHDFKAIEDPIFNDTRAQLISGLASFNQQLSVTENKQISLDNAQQQFAQLTKLSQHLAERADLLIGEQAKLVNQSAEKIKGTLLNSLVVIPFVLILAAIFTILITRPLKQLTRQINQLEKGRFEQHIRAKGSLEVVEIANALELMRARLQALELQKSSFIRHISHELKTPLAAIREGTELIYDHSVGKLNSEQQEITEIIRLNVTRLQQLIEDLLNFNIVLDSTSLQDRETINIEEEIDKAIDLRKLDFKVKNIEIIRLSSPIKFACNRKQLSVILDNLLSNAIKFSPKDGKITIDVSSEHHRLNIAIEDQGPGIQESDRQKIFEAFYQGNDFKQDKIKSSGLGLTIVKELLLRLNGTINVVSQTSAPTMTRFCVSLPLILTSEAKFSDLTKEQIA